MDKKSVLCVEHQLQKDEARWAAQQADTAEIRRRKEKFSLNNRANSELQHRKCVDKIYTRVSLLWKYRYKR